jgi:tetratricopeptide (TPR) repeat protein
MNAPALRSPAVQAQLSRGLALHQAGEHLPAADCYRAALAHSPDDAVALGLLGTLEVELRRPAEALPLLLRSAELAPGNASTLFNLGLLLRKQGRPAEALAWFERACALRPASVLFLRELAETQHDLAPQSKPAIETWEELLVLADETLSTDAEEPEALFSRGRALLNLGRPGDALEAFSRVASVAGHRAGVHLELGHCHRALRQFDDAHAAYSIALARNPGDVIAMLNLGNASLCQGRFDEAVERFREVLREVPQDRFAWYNLGTALEDQGQHDEALACFERALELAPGWSAAEDARAHAFLLAGDFARGWAAHEARLASPSVPWSRRDFGAPCWDGRADLSGRTLLVWAEQGLGDAIMFSRFLTPLARLGARVLLEVHDPLVGLLRRVEGVASVVPFEACVEQRDFHCALMSLPHLLGQRQGYAIPSPDAYLKADSARIAQWAPQMDLRPNVGLAWSGNPRHNRDFRRSVPLEKLLAHLPDGVRPWCVQKDVRERDDATLRAAPHVLRPALGDFDDTAALIANLDAVITVDTSIAHLAGALGKPTLLLLPQPAEWRWQLDRADTPWYGSLRLCRQKETGDWDSALAEAMSHLGRIMRSAASGADVAPGVA